MSNFNKISPEAITDNVFDLISKQWMLITAGNRKSFNMMTASWGGLGVIWNSPVAFSFIRPQRYTMEFMERSERYTLCFFDEEYRKALNICGSRSGRDCDKAALAGLTPAADNDTVYFSEARLVLFCRKMMAQYFDPENFAEGIVDEHYPQKDYHRFFIGSIYKVLARQ